MSLRLVPCSRPRLAQCPPGAQTSNQLTLECATPLDKQRLVDRLVTDTHGLIIREIDLKPVRDLLWAPRRRPPTILPVRLAPALPSPPVTGPATTVPSARFTDPSRLS